nr:unnamed protein product [Spirometra erinaceieuropaei]
MEILCVTLLICRSAGNSLETVGPVLDSILFPAAAVEKELKNLKEAKSSGPDNIPAKFLKELANELSKPLAHIFRSSFELGRLPSEWKTANIFPIYKGGARTNANNYRPVSLTCICCKIMEAIVKKATMEFLEPGHLISDLQHGFRQNRSCLSSLLLSTEQWTRALDEDGRVDVIHTDFKKAFDSVPHKRLIYKLSEIGIRGRMLTWITDFLTGRSQTVCIEASRSTPTPVLSGVPQGSVLGPLLFLVYINDCVDDLGCSAIMFADDVKLWRSIRSDADSRRSSSKQLHLRPQFVAGPDNWSINAVDGEVADSEALSRELQKRAEPPLRNLRCRTGSSKWKSTSTWTSCPPFRNLLHCAANLQWASPRLQYNPSRILQARQPPPDGPTHDAISGDVALWASSSRLQTLFTSVSTSANGLTETAADQPGYLGEYRPEQTGMTKISDDRRHHRIAAVKAETEACKSHVPHLPSASRQTAPNMTALSTLVPGANRSRGTPSDPVCQHPDVYLFLHSRPPPQTPRRPPPRHRRLHCLCSTTINQQYHSSCPNHCVDLSDQLHHYDNDIMHSYQWTTSDAPSPLTLPPPAVVRVCMEWRTDGLRVSLMFSAMLIDAHRDGRPGISIPYRTANFSTSSGCTSSGVHKLLFLDHCALNTTAEGDMQRSMDLFAAASYKFGLVISTEKTVVMH